MFFKSETPAQILSCEFCENFKTSFLQNTLGRLFLYLWNNFNPIVHEGSEVVLKHGGRGGGGGKI